MADTKRCSTCHEVLPVTDFNRRSTASDGLQWRCRSCCYMWYEQNRVRHGRVTRVRTSEVRTALALRITRYLFDHPCVDCGEDDVRCLEFDHRDRTTKLANVSAMIASQYSWDKIMTEIEKCDVRCANCHRKRTAIQLNTRKQRFMLERMTGRSESWPAHDDEA